MRNNQIIGMFPVFNPALTDPAKTTLADQILNALNRGVDEAVITGLLTGAGTTTIADATTSAKAIKMAFDKEVEAERLAHLARPAARWGAVMATLTVIGIALLLYLAFSRPMAVSKDEVAELLKPVATAEQVKEATKDLATVELVTGVVNSQTETTKALARLEEATQGLATAEQVKEATRDLATTKLVTGVVNSQTETAKALARLEEATDGLAKKSDLDEAVAGLETKVDVVAASAGRTEAIVTKGLTYRVRCRKDSNESTCVECFARDEKRCYYRRPFQAASARQVAEIPHLVRGKVVEATEPPKVEQPKVEEPKAEEPKAEEPKAEEPKATGVTTHKLLPAAKKKG